MHLSSNLERLQQRFPAAADVLRQSGPVSGWQTQPAYAGGHTLYRTKDGQTDSLHSPVFPLGEAERWIERFQTVEPGAHVIFFGVGLGYHLQAFHQMHPHIPFSVIEPEGGPLLAGLSLYPLEQLIPWQACKHLYIGKPGDSLEIVQFLKGMIDQLSKALVIVWPAYSAIYRTETEQFNELLRASVTRKRENLAVNHFFQKLWTGNSVHNFGHVFRSPELFAIGNKALRGKPVVLVAAGPSLEEELPYLKQIKDQGLAYLFSVGSAINTLVEYGVYPDATFTYDPQLHNVQVLQKVIDRGIDTIPIIFGSTVGQGTLDAYPGPKLHVLISQDQISSYFLKKSDGSPLTYLNDAPSVAIIAIQALLRLQCAPIVLVGQNFAYRNAAYYASGVPYGSGHDDSKQNDMLMVQDVHGGEAASNRSLLKMKTEMEVYLQQYPNVEVINTTQGGAAIRGTSFRSLSDLLADRLTTRVTEADWFKGLSGPDGLYDLSYLDSQAKAICEETAAFERLLQAIESLLMQMGVTVRDRHTQRLEPMFPVFDDLFEQLVRNHAFRLYIQPRHRVAFEMLYGKTGLIKWEHDSLEKALKVLRFFGDFISACRQEYTDFSPDIHRFHNTLNQY